MQNYENKNFAATLLLHNLPSATHPPLPSGRRFFNVAQQCYFEMKTNTEPYFSILSSIILWIDRIEITKNSSHMTLKTWQTELKSPKIPRRGDIPNWYRRIFHPYDSKEVTDRIEITEYSWTLTWRGDRPNWNRQIFHPYDSKEVTDRIEITDYSSTRNSRDW